MLKKQQSQQTFCGFDWNLWDLPCLLSWREYEIPTGIRRLLGENLFAKVSLVLVEGVGNDPLLVG
jgi:hypothetical protein